ILTTITMHASRKEPLSFSTPFQAAAGNLILCTGQEQSANRAAWAFSEPLLKALPAPRRVRTDCCVHIHMQMRCRIDPRRIAIPIRIVVSAHAREVLASRRLRELPNLGKWPPAFGRFGFGKGTSRRGRTDVIGDPVHDPTFFCV